MQTEEAIPDSTTDTKGAPSAAETLSVRDQPVQPVRQRGRVLTGELGFPADGTREGVETGRARVKAGEALTCAGRASTDRFLRVRAPSCQNHRDRESCAHMFCPSFPVGWTRFHVLSMCKLSILTDRAPR